MNNLGNNKLIAEFMGYPTMIWNDPDPIEGNDYKVSYFKQLCSETAIIQYGGGSEAEVFLSEIEDIELLYHTSWDWLMPVVEEMHTYGCEVVISSNGVTTIYAPSGEVLAEESSEDMRDATYKAIVKVLQENLHKPCE